MPHKKVNNIKLDRWQYQQWNPIDLSNATEINVNGGLLYFDAA